MKIEVNCTECDTLLGVYDGPDAGVIASNYYTRHDGTHPQRGSVAKENCPKCGHEHNIVMMLYHLHQVRQNKEAALDSGA